jgi:hypothetical protein
MKISNEEVNVIITHLIAIGLLARTYDLGKNTLELRVTNKGMQTYATLLHLFGKNKILTGPFMTNELIESNLKHHLRQLLLDERFVTIVELDEYTLTNRGAEHINVMFKPNFKGHVSKIIKLCKMIKRLKD